MKESGRINDKKGGSNSVLSGFCSTFKHLSDVPYVLSGVKQVALFGSFAAGTATKDSDVDLVVEFDRPMGLKFVSLSEYLEKLLGRRVDVLTPEGINGIRSRPVAMAIRRSLKYVA